MARMEEVSQGNYIRMPDKVQQEIIKIVNKYFASDLADIENSKEGIILEIQQRLKPLIVNLVRTIVMKEGSELLEPIIADRIEEELKHFEKEIAAIIEEIKNSLNKSQEFDYKVTADTQTVPIATSIKFKIDATTVIVAVNGMLQNENENYLKVADSDGNIVAIRFNDVLTAPDIAKVVCFSTT